MQVPNQLPNQLPNQVVSSDKPNFLLYGAIGGVFLIVVVIIILVIVLLHHDEKPSPAKASPKAVPKVLSKYCRGTNTGSNKANACNTLNTQAECVDPTNKGCNWSGPPYFDCNGIPSDATKPCTGNTTQAACLDPCTWSGTSYCSGTSSDATKPCTGNITQATCEPPTTNGCSWLPKQPHCNTKDKTDTENQTVCSDITDQTLCVPTTHKCLWTGPQAPPPPPALSDMNMGFSMKF